MTTTLRHPDPSTLVSFAAGSLCEPLAAVVASHVCMCADCRADVSDLELVGAALLTSAEPDASGSPAASPKARVDEKAKMPKSMAASQVGTGERAPRADRLPAPLAVAFGLSFDTIPWKRLAPNVWHHKLPLSSGVEGDLRLLKIGRGCAMPDHGHGGSELTLVLDGAYSDETGEYRRGDVQDADEGLDHAPVADRGTGCICLIASERPARFKSLVGKLMQPWTGM